MHQASNPPLSLILSTHQAAEARTYIPQRLEEIEREEALLKTRMEDFNEKLKDTDLTQL